VPPKRLILFLIAAFCRLAKSLSHSEQIGWLVGAVGIEIASLLSKSNKGNGVAPPPHFQLEPFGATGCRITAYRLNLLFSVNLMT
jgi:hypothetical protein